ncbi:PAS domain-containing hybrid sensor histidine kinase/response regulator [Allorhodopirellula solitaria]|uniref:histidine kinase n=1 Tax=Allorhodopirellula solitaria TaxID=2527987 RepID=A0A5C5Y1B5_9BACT|nr:PAS domain S-box protein [Allorhodopirellula solitaria]TWT67392.1 Autoinducer 2 sensor kinase/phosphatase LuxQ [Allorhodopirellula solitaria]
MPKSTKSTPSPPAANERAELLCVALASIGDAVIATDLQGRVTTLNEIAENLTGWTKSTAMGEPFEKVFQAVSEQSGERVECPAAQTLRDGAIVEPAGHTILIASDGTERSIDSSAAPIRSDNGEVTGCVLVFRDVTKRRQLERDHAEGDHHARLLGAIVTSSDDAIISKSLDGTIRSWNAAAERIFGYTEEQAIGRHISMLIPAERIEEEDHIIARIRAGERVEHFETVRLRSDGRLVFVSLTISPIKNAEGQIIGASKIARDISERKRTQEVLREHEQRFRTFVEQVEDYAIFVTDTAGRATSWNEGVLRVLGFEEAEFVGKDIVRSIFRSSDVAKGVPQAELAEAAESGSASNDRWMKRKDGTPFWAAGVTTGLQDESGNLLGFMKVMRDQTKQKQMEDELRRIATELSEADRRKDEFLATLAHELRNPLAPIRTGLSAMKLLQDDPDQMEEIRETMERQAQQMVRLIDDLLEMSRITQGKLELRKCRVMLADVVRSAVEATRPLMDEVGHELSVTLPSRGIELEADPNRLTQVFSNLLNNAAKYTPDGGRISLAVERQESEVIVSVKDNGMGIPPDKIERVFEMFAQIKHPLDAEYSGLGIGLTLVKSLVELHAGSIEVRSNPTGQGCEFLVRLPLGPANPVSPAPETPTEETGSLAKCRVLIVDDNQAAADMLRIVVKTLGHDVRVACNGQEGVEIASVFRPETVLMDIGMPQLNGFEAARHIRQQPWGQQMTLVALTGWGQEDDKRKTQEAGFDHHLVKPVELVDLRRILDS